MCSCFAPPKTLFENPELYKVITSLKKNQNQGRLISSEIDRHVINTISDNTFGSCRVGILTTPGNENINTWGHTYQNNLEKRVRRAKPETCEDQK